METEKFIGIYDAEGTFWGELKYAWKKLTAKASCSLCDITHKGLSEHSDWQNCRAELPVPFEVIHLNERSAELLQFSSGKTPCVLAQSQKGYSLVLDDEQLKAFQGQPRQLVQALKAYLFSQEI